jgi:tRNA-specific 2-thiouridylase
MAEDRGLPVADKPKSQDLCFVPDGRYPEFVREYVSPTPGNIVDLGGNVLGGHKGVAFYTIGQRTGLGIAAGRRLYVIAINAADNSVVVGSEDQLFASRLVAGSARFVSRRPESPMTIKAKIRYKSPEVGATLHPREGGMEILFEKPQRAVSPGQAVVLYQGDQVLGGGVIEAS